MDIHVCSVQVSLIVVLNIRKAPLESPILNLETSLHANMHLTIDKS